MVSDKLKEIIFKKLYMDLRDVEIIPYEDSIYFINRKEKYWYLEFERSGKLWWRYEFFSNFFSLFSMDDIKYSAVISEWVEEVLNHKVYTTYGTNNSKGFAVEEVLNHKVSTTYKCSLCLYEEVEEVLNHKAKVSTTFKISAKRNTLVEEVLNHKVSEASPVFPDEFQVVEEVLNNKVLSSLPLTASTPGNMDEILNGGDV